MFSDEETKENADYRQQIYDAFVHETKVMNFQEIHLSSIDLCTNKSIKQKLLETITKNRYGLMH
jgi:hypothetical protein